MTSLVVRGLLVAILLAAGAALWGLSEARRTAGRNLRLSAALEIADRRVVTAEEELAATLAVHAAGSAHSTARLAYLEGELARALAQVAAVNERLEERRSEIERLRVEHDTRWRRAVAPMPEGVRLAVRTLCELLRDDGFDELRVLHASRLADGELCDVELVERTDRGLSFTFYRVGRLAAELDRPTGALRLRLAEGHVLRDGTIEDLPADGACISLANVDGPRWEARVPYLLTASGEYPERDRPQLRPRQVDPITAARWAERVDRLLAEATTVPIWSVRKIGDFVAGGCVDIRMLGTHSNGLLAASAAARRAEVEVDRQADTVALVLRDGALRRRTGETTIPDQGYRILLVGVTPARASELMMGMVHEVGRRELSGTHHEATPAMAGETGIR